MNALTVVSLRSLLLVFSITMTITEIYTYKYVGKKKSKISFLQKTLSSKFHEVSPATAQKSIIKKIKIILFTLANLKFPKKKIMVEKEEDTSICCEPNFLLCM